MSSPLAVRQHSTRFHPSRGVTASLVGLLAWLLGIASVLSFNLWSGDEYKIFGKTLFDLKDFVASNIMLPLGGLLIALFVAYGAGRRMALDELAIRGQGLGLAWQKRRKSAAQAAGRAGSRLISNGAPVGSDNRQSSFRTWL